VRAHFCAGFGPHCDENGPARRDDGHVLPQDCQNLWKIQQGRGKLYSLRQLVPPGTKTADVAGSAINLRGAD